MIENSKVGVLIPLTWDDNKWECGEEFIRSRPKYKLLKDYFQAQEKIIFGHKKYPLNELSSKDHPEQGSNASLIYPIVELPSKKPMPDRSGSSSTSGAYFGYSRMISQILSEVDYFYWNSDDFKAVFFVSTKTVQYIVGFYLYPEIDWGFSHLAKHEVYKTFTYGNIAAYAEDIVRFDNYLPIRNVTKLSSTIKELKESNHAYIDNIGITTILDEAIKLNPEQKDLKLAAERLKKDISKSSKKSKT